MEYLIIDWHNIKTEALETMLNSYAESGWTPFMTLNDHTILLNRTRRTVQIQDGHIWAHMQEHDPLIPIGSLP